MAFKYKGLRLKNPSLMKRLRRVTGITFTRNSVAYDYYGNPIPANTPRFGFGGIDGVLIEEAHTNLMPASESQSLSAPYTTGTLNGTYTFMIQGSGSITLSGGATGTVTPGNPVTATVSSATVTLTPTGTATLNQILNLAYPLSWTLGGTTQAAEIISVPINVLKLSTITIECEIYINTKVHNLAGKYPQVLSYADGSTVAYNYMVALVNKNTGWYATSVAPTTSTDPISLSTGWHKFTLRLDSTSIVLTVDGDIVNQKTKTNPTIPQAVTRLKLGGDYYGVNQLNSVFKNVVISLNKRSDGDSQVRALQPSPTVDKNVSLVFPLKNDLRAYRVVTV